MVAGLEERLAHSVAASRIDIQAAISGAGRTVGRNASHAADAGVAALKF
jgi:hypothetical protein